MGISRWIILAAYYYGHHVVYVGAHRLVLFEKVNAPCSLSLFDQRDSDASCVQAFVGVQVLYFLNAVLTKTSLLLLYYRIFGVAKSFRYALWTTGGIVLGYWIATTILAFLGCTPFARNWNKTIPGHCVNLVMFFRWNGICNLIIDVLILLLPLPMVWRLRVPSRQRLELSGIFLLGLL